MPDHVRNPHKYTCYALEEPLTVGGGGDAAADGAQAEMEQVLHCTLTFTIGAASWVASQRIGFCRACRCYTELWEAPCKRHD